MKTKEINVWVNKSIIEIGDPTKFYDIYVIDKNNPHLIKAKLIIEDPEPEIKITPSMLRAAIESTAVNQYYGCVGVIIENLFGKEWDK